MPAWGEMASFRKMAFFAVPDGWVRFVVGPHLRLDSPIRLVAEVKGRVVRVAD